MEKYIYILYISKQEIISSRQIPFHTSCILFPLSASILRSTSKAITPFIPPPSILRIRIPFIGKGLTTPSLVNVSFAANLTARSSDLSALIASGIAPSLVAKPKNQVIRIYLQN